MADPIYNGGDIAPIQVFAQDRRVAPQPDLSVFDGKTPEELLAMNREYPGSVPQRILSGAMQTYGREKNAPFTNALLTTMAIPAAGVAAGTTAPMWVPGAKAALTTGFAPFSGSGTVASNVLAGAANGMTYAATNPISGAMIADRAIQAGRRNGVIDGLNTAAGDILAGGAYGAVTAAVPAIQAGVQRIGNALKPGVSAGTSAYPNLRDVSASARQLTPKDLKKLSNKSMNTQLTGYQRAAQKANRSKLDMNQSDRQWSEYIDQTNREIYNEKLKLENLLRTRNNQTSVLTKPDINPNTFNFNEIARVQNNHARRHNMWDKQHRDRSNWKYNNEAYFNTRYVPKFKKPNIPKYDRNTADWGYDGNIQSPAEYYRANTPREYVQNVRSARRGYFTNDNIDYNKTPTIHQSHLEHNSRRLPVSSNVSRQRLNQRYQFNDAETRFNQIKDDYNKLMDDKLWLPSKIKSPFLRDFYKNQ